MEKKAILIRADGTEQALTPQKKPDLKQMQTWVGGYIERVKVRYEGHIRTMYVNEEGLLLNLQFNQKASSICKRTIVGDVFILVGWR